jgi:ATP-binding cassette subfamily G (WHITE) protein 2 (PDR)
MEKLTRNGQAILCTVHQPSSLLFQRFDRLLLLAKGGRTVYFGDVGRDSKVLLDYFARNGAPQCPAGTNPAEYMLEAIGAAPGAHTSIDWPAVWKESAEYSSVQDELARLRDLASQPSAVIDSEGTHQEFAAPFTTQLRAVALRCAQQYWRTPSYIYSKAVLTVGSSLLIGFSFFKGENSMQGLQNQMFGVFVFLFVVIQLMYQIMPLFVTQRTMYEARERQSKTYAWQAFVLSNIAIEMAWNVVSYSGTFPMFAANRSSSWLYSASWFGTILSASTATQNGQILFTSVRSTRFSSSSSPSSLPVHWPTC